MACCSSKVPVLLFFLAFLVPCAGAALAAQGEKFLQGDELPGIIGWPRPVHMGWGAFGVPGSQLPQTGARTASMQPHQKKQPNRKVANVAPKQSIRKAAEVVPTQPIRKDAEVADVAPRHPLRKAAEIDPTQPIGKGAEDATTQPPQRQEAPDVGPQSEEAVNIPTARELYRVSQEIKRSRADLEAVQKSYDEKKSLHAEVDAQLTSASQELDEQKKDSAHLDRMVARHEKMYDRVLSALNRKSGILDDAIAKSKEMVNHMESLQDTHKHIAALKRSLGQKFINLPVVIKESVPTSEPSS